MQTSDSTGYRQSELAKRLNVKPPAISKEAKKGENGRLRGCLVYDQNGTAKIADLDAAVAAWHSRGDYTDAPQRGAAASMPVDNDDDGTPTLQNAAARAKHWEAETKELEYRKKAGELVRAADIESRLVNVITHCKTRLLAIPSRAKQELPQLTLKDLEVLEGLIREALEDLTGGAAPPDVGGRE